MSIYAGKNVLVTGGTGFVGRHLVEALISAGANVAVSVISASDADILPQLKGKVEFRQGNLTHLEDAVRITKGVDFVFHLAGLVKGVKYNKAHPAEMLTQNLMINTATIEAARLNKVERYLFASSIYVYPLSASRPLSEEEPIDGPIEPASEGYIRAKRIGELQAKAYAEEYEMKIAIVRLSNIYGPGVSFDLESGYVIPTFISRAAAKEDPFVIYGNAKSTRSFIYVSDVVDGMLRAMEKYCTGEPLNIGTEEETSIGGLAMMILSCMGHSPKIVYDAQSQKETTRISVNIAKAREKIGFMPKVKLEEGLKKTIEWYLANKNSIHK